MRQYFATGEMFSVAMTDMPLLSTFQPRWEDFHLREVATAPLAQRRKLMRSSQDTCHSSSSSGGYSIASSFSRGSASPSPLKRASPLTLLNANYSSRGNRFFFPHNDTVAKHSLSNATRDSGMSSSSQLSFSDLCAPAPSPRDLSECDDVEGSVAELQISAATAVRGIKRRLVAGNNAEDTHNKLDDSDDDDCIIIEERSTQKKRHRASTIVID